MARAVCCAQLQEGFHLGLQSLKSHPTGGIVAAEGLDQMVGEETLHVVQHACGASVHFLHLVWRQQHGLTVRATGHTQKNTRS